MSAFLQIYLDAAHTTEATKSTIATNTLSSSSAAGATTLSMTGVTNFNVSGGYIDIIDVTNGNESIPYLSISGTTITLARPTTLAHASGLTVNYWRYSLPIGDQTNGILNDGSASTPVVANTATFYLRNTGDQAAQSPQLATSSSSPSTTSGFADTLLSITSASAGFATTVSPANIAAASQVQFWVVAEVPNGQSNAGNPQFCLINLSYQTI